MRNDGYRKIANTIAPLVLEDYAVYGVADDASQKQYEGIYHALDQREGYHIPIGDVADFMGHYCFHLFWREAL